ncbi:otoferlin-like [Watersipora subatra]|uniref:otoferlin-like n=1 Tax=Watersipora subatra TaxID=2589382 RepID=UPI00355C34AF
MSSRARTIKSTLTMTNLKDKLYQCQEMLHEIHKLSLEPQDSLPDVFVWMLVAGKRIAYFRIPARDILYSDADLKRGRLCGKLKTLTLKLPGKRSQGQSGWQMQAKLTMILWLGLNEERDKFYASLPPDCNPKTSSIPRSLSCASTSQFQLRAHLYQARALIGSDSSGLSDPYATVTFGEFVAQTKVISETLSPTWNQMLIIDDITLPYPAGEWLKTCPPMITIEIYDHDSIASAAGILTKGSPEYLGRAFAYPLVKLCDDPYKPPMFPALLQWWHIQRGQSPSGELLASFELFQKPFDAEEVYKLLLTPRLAPKHRRICSEGLPLTVSKHDVETAMRMEKNAIIPIPGSIRPVFSKHRIEVLFWGMRDLKKLQFTAVTRPKIDVECAGKVISSIPLTDANINPNFSVTVQHTEVDLPEDQTYCPPITIRCVDCRNFGRFVLVGTHTISSLQRYLFKTKASLSKDNLDAIKPAGESDAEVASVSELFKDKPSNGGIPTVLPSGTTQANATGNVAAGFKLLNNTSTAVDTSQSINSGLKNFGMELSRFGPKRSSSRKMRKPIKVKDKELDDIDWSSLDWWSKYYASADKQEKKSNQTGNKETTVRVDDEGVSALITTQTGDQISLNSSGSDEYSHGHTDTDMTSSSANFKYIQTLTIYDKELESVKEFEGFAEWLHTFSLLRGKKTTDEEDDDSRIVGKFKGCLQIYKCPPMLGPKDVNIVGGDPAQGMFAGVPSNDPVKVLVRVYVVLAKELHPADLNGKADPYLVIKLGSKTINDVENYIPKQLNPVFGKCFEQEVTFPMESTLSVQIWDYDRLSKNDLIGETKIDLENRFYSRHRASCGLPSVYHSSGYNIWRDREKPTTILAKRCKASNMGPPHYRLHQAKVTVAGRDFFLKEDLAADLAASYDASHTEENLALNVLKQWHELQPGGCALVPEHVETRSLYNSEKPGIEQGKVQMWVDIFPLDAPALPPTIDISPRKPKGYELRVTIWNTDEVILEEDDFFTGEKSSDIYVKGWLTGPDNSQSTDVHYRSLTGEGNFNWRFVLAFDYLLAEQKIVVTKKDSIFSWDESETKMPAKLTLQVWDADHISADDFLGAFTGDLTRFPRGAKSMEACQLIDSTIPTVNIFKQKRIKGWWPFEQADGTIAGKVEAEIELVTAEDAEQRPVGLGREAPEPLEKPNRPDTAFLWFLNPLKSVQYLFCKRFKGICIKLFIAVALVMLIVLLVYNIPGYAAKRMLGA